MSTKTTLKRVAVIAALALALGGVTTVSAQATGNANLIATATAITGPGAVVTQVAGVANFVTINNTLNMAAPSVYYAISGGATTSGATTGTVLSGSSILVSTPAAGTITVTGYQITAGAASLTPTDTVTITVVASIPGTVYGSSNVYGAPGVTVPSPATDSSFAVTTVAGGSNVANFSVTQLDANSVALSSGIKSVTVTSTNALLTSASSFATPISSTTYISAVPTTNVANFVLSGVPGLGGVATINIAVNGVSLKSYKVTFTGVATKLVLTAVNPVIAVGNSATLLPNITANTDALEVQEFDANGNAVAVNLGNIVITPASSVTAGVGAADNSGVHTLGDIAGGTATSSGVVGYSLNGLTAGSTSFIATDSALSLSSSPVAIRVSSGVATKVVFSADAATYAAGGSGKLTTTLSDAVGSLPAGTYTVLSAQATSSLALSVGGSSLPGVGPVLPASTPILGSVVVNDSGLYTSSFNAPISDGSVTITATGVNNSVAVTPVTFTVSSGSTDAAKAATAAANEATAAAKAATDAANAAGASANAAITAATDAGNKAGAALAAVTALSQQVTRLLAKVAVLAALIAKIVKKIRA